MSSVQKIFDTCYAPDTATGTAGTDAGEAMVSSTPDIYLKAFCEHESSCTHQLIPGDSSCFLVTADPSAAQI